MNKIRCTKDARAISFQVPIGQDPIRYGKKKLREMTGKKRLIGWEFKIL